MENQTGNKKKNTKSTVVLILCFGGAFLFFIMFLFSMRGMLNSKEDDVSESGNSTNTNIQYEFLDTDESVTESELSDNEGITETQDDTEEIIETEPDTLDENEIQDTTYNDGFIVNGVPEELLTFINNDTGGISQAIQKALYENGYYDYTAADFADYAELDYGENTASISFTVTANVTVSVDAIYYRETSEWQIQIW